MQQLTLSRVCVLTASHPTVQVNLDYLDEYTLDKAITQCLLGYLGTTYSVQGVCLDCKSPYSASQPRLPR